MLAPVLIHCIHAAQVHAHFRPEFVNRVDEFVVFQPLQLGQIKQIVRLQVRQAPRKGDLQGITDPPS